MVDVSERRFAEGEQASTVSGALTTPFPRVDVSTPRKTELTIRRVRAWLHENAKAEIARRGLIDTIPESPRSMSPADGYTAEAVLFDSGIEAGDAYATPGRTER